MKDFNEVLDDIFGETEMSSFEKSWYRPYNRNMEFYAGCKPSNDNWANWLEKENK